jgi:hypothetical protein
MIVIGQSAGLPRENCMATVLNVRYWKMDCDDEAA